MNVNPSNSNPLSSNPLDSQPNQPFPIRPVGRPKVIPDSYLERLQDLVHQGPRACGYPFRVWTASWLSQHLARETGIRVSQRHINRLLKQMGLSTRQAVARQRSQTRITVEDLKPAQPVANPWLWSFDEQLSAK